MEATANELKADAQETAAFAVFDALTLLLGEAGLGPQVAPEKVDQWARTILASLLRSDVAWAIGALVDADATWKVRVQDRREALAAHVHVVWARWMDWQAKHARLIPEAVMHHSAVTHRKQINMIERWERQAETAYWDLSDSEKASDRVIADEYLAIVQGKDAVDGAGR
jgi:hypothetical protein